MKYINKKMICLFGENSEVSIKDVKKIFDKYDIELVVYEKKNEE